MKSIFYNLVLTYAARNCQIQYGFWQNKRPFSEEVIQCLLGSVIEYQTLILQKNKGVPSLIKLVLHTQILIKNCRDSVFFLLNFYFIYHYCICVRENTGICVCSENKVGVCFLFAPWDLGIKLSFPGSYPQHFSQ